jgi:hypothetical protein
VKAETGVWQGCLEDLFDFNTPSLGEFEEVGGKALYNLYIKVRNNRSLGEFEDVGGKALYNLCIKFRNIRSITGVKAHQWQGVCGAESMVDFRWRGLYKPPVPKRSGDLQWRILHGALATNSWLARVEPS